MSRIGVGTVIAERYELLELCGFGGHASVWRARQLNNTREVALKLLKARLDPRSREQLEQRFQREAKVMSAIRHPNVVTVFDFGFFGAERKPFLAMELLEGDNLSRTLDRDGPMSPERVFRLMLGVTDALSAGHKRGIVHKDLKPANLFVDTGAARGERIVLLDYGVAVFQNTTRLTLPGRVSGTPQYLPPEYLTDNLVSPAFDVFQIGLVLVEMLTATPLIVGNDPLACFDAIRDGALELPPSLARGELAPLLHRALTPDPAERYPHGAALRDALMKHDPARTAWIS